MIYVNVTRNIYSEIQELIKNLYDYIFIWYKFQILIILYKLAQIPIHSNFQIYLIVEYNNCIIRLNDFQICCSVKILHELRIKTFQAPFNFRAEIRYAFHPLELIRDSTYITSRNLFLSFHCFTRELEENL